MIPSMRTVRHGLGTLCRAMSVVSATETPVIRPPAICHLSVTIGGAGTIVVRWEAGTPPFIVVRGDAENFTAAGDLRILATDVSGREYRDIADGRKRYWYQVADRNSPPLLFWTDPRDPHEGDPVTIHGVGFAPNCKDNHLILGGRRDEVPLQSCTATRLQFKVPLHTTSDELMVMTDRGLGRFGSTLDDCEGIPRGPVTWSSAAPTDR